MERISTVFFYQLEKAIKTYRQFAQRSLKEKGFRITVDQWLLLKTLSDNPDATQNELAEAVFKDKASVTRIVGALALKGYVVKEIHTNKRRSKLVITPKGQKLLEKIIPAVTAYRRTALEGIAEEDVMKTQVVLKAIIYNCNAQ